MKHKEAIYICHQMQCLVNNFHRNHRICSTLIHFLEQKLLRSYTFDYKIGLILVSALKWQNVFCSTQLKTSPLTALVESIAQHKMDLISILFTKYAQKRKKYIKPVVLRPPCNGKRYNLRKHADLIKAGHVEACLTPSRRVSDKCSCSFFRQRNVKPFTLKNALSRSMKQICKNTSTWRVKGRIL